MKEILIQVPDDGLLALKLNSEEVGSTLRLAAAVKLYELGKLSSGAAANLAGIPKVVFLSKLTDYGVNTFNLTEDEIKSETRLV